jgi:hypothetical protein
MPQIRSLNPKRLALLAGLAFIGAGLVCNEWGLTRLFSPDGELAQHSVVIIWVFDVVVLAIGLVLVLSKSFGTLLNVLIGLGLTVLLLAGAERLFYRLNRPEPSSTAAAGPRVWHEGDYTHGFFQPDEQLGYTARPSAQVTSIKKLDDRVVYNVVYSIDEYHRRVTPVTAPQQRSKSLLFFGDSFTFGEGVNDDETLPYHVARLATEYQPYNYGLSGYGPQQMLAKLQSDDLTREVPEQDAIAIYVFIDGHIERALGSMYVYNTWGDQMPYYSLDWQDNLVRNGNFTTGRPLRSAFYTALAQSEIARYYNVNIPPRLAEQHYGFAARIIAEARDEFETRFGSDDFYVVIYPDEGDYVEDMIPHFERLGLQYLNYDEMMKLSVEDGLAIAGDGHPTGTAHKLVAEWIVTDLGIAAMTDN